MKTTLKNNTEFKAEVTSDDGSSYNFFLIYQDEKFNMKLSQKFNPIFWENAFSLNVLASENKVWYYFEDDSEFFTKLVEAFEGKSVTLQKKTENQRIIQIKIDKKPYSLPLNAKKGDITQNIEDMVDNIRKLEEEIVKLKTNAQKTDVIPFNTFSFIPGNNNGNYTLSNNNKTIEKIQGGSAWCGFRCDPPAKISDKMAFSIKVENTDGNCSIMVGWCLKNANHSSGYYATNADFAIYLNNKGLKNDIFTAIIDIKMKTIMFLLNGYLIGNPKRFELQDEEIGLLCPFVDIQTPGDKVSIYDIENVKVPSFFFFNN